MLLIAVRPASASAAASICESAIGLFGDDRGLDRNFFGVGALLADVEDAEHRVADFQIADTGAGRGYRSGEIASENEGKRRLRVFAGPYLPVGGIDARRDHVDDDFTRPRNRVRHVAVLQNLGAAKFFNVDRFHGCHLVAA